VPDRVGNEDHEAAIRLNCIIVLKFVKYILKRHSGMGRIYINFICVKIITKLTYHMLEEGFEKQGSEPIEESNDIEFKANIGIQMENVVYALFEGDVAAFETLVEKYSFSKEERISALIEGLAQCALNDQVDRYRYMQDHFRLRKPLVQKVAEKVILRRFYIGGRVTLSDAFEIFQIPAGLLQASAAKAMELILSKGYAANAFGIPEDFHLSPALVKKIVHKAMCESLCSGDLKSFLTIKEGFDFDDKVFYKFPRFTESAIQGVIRNLKEEKEMKAHEIVELFPRIMESGELFEESSKILVSKFVKGDINGAMDLQRLLYLSNSCILDAGKIAYQECLSKKKQSIANMIRRKFMALGINLHVECQGCR
jgi:hypothetical protein